MIQSPFAGRIVFLQTLMSVVFNHGRRHGFIDRNPISLVRQSKPYQTSFSLPRSIASPAASFCKTILPMPLIGTLSPKATMD